MTTPRTPFYYGWAIVAFVALMQALSNGLIFYGFGVALLAWMKTFHAGRTELSGIAFIAQIAIAVVSIFVGPLFDRFPARRLIVAGLVSLALGLLALSLSQSVFQIMLVHATLLAIGGVGAGAFAAQTLVAKWFSRRRGLALAITAGGVGVGGMVMPPILSHTIPAFGWQASYAGLATFVGLVLVPLAFMVVRDPPAVLDPVEHMPAHQGMDAADRPAPRTAAIVLHPIFLVTSLGVAALMAVHMALQYFLPSMATTLGENPARAALLLSILAGASLVSKPVWGFLMDRSDMRGIFAAMVLAYGGMLIVLAGGTGPIDYARLAIGASVCGFASGAIQPFLGVILARTFGRANFGRALGLAIPVLNVSAAGPVFIAAVYERSGSYALAAYVLLALLALFLALFTHMLRSGTDQSPPAPATAPG